MATRFGKLALNDAPRTLVFRAVDDILREDSVLRRVVKRWATFRGDPKDKTDLAIAESPAIRLRPIPAAESYWYPGATKGELFVQAEILIEGLWLDDVENLWYAVERALCPRDQTAVLAIHAKLKAAGAMTGIITFSQPAYDPTQDAGSSGVFCPVGQFKLEVQTS